MCAVPGEEMQISLDKAADFKWVLASRASGQLKAVAGSTPVAGSPKDVWGIWTAHHRIYHH